MNLWWVVFIVFPFISLVQNLSLNVKSWTRMSSDCCSLKFCCFPRLDPKEEKE